MKYEDMTIGMRVRTIGVTYICDSVELPTGSIGTVAQVIASGSVEDYPDGVIFVELDRPIYSAVYSATFGSIDIHPDNVAHASAANVAQDFEPIVA